MPVANRVYGYTLSVVMVALVLWLGCREEDSFPLSNFPMFSYARPDALFSLTHALGVTPDGSRVPLPPEVTCGRAAAGRFIPVRVAGHAPRRPLHRRYLLAGVAKMANSGGIGFIADDTLRNYIAFDNVRKIELGSIHSPLGALLLPHRWLFTGLAALSIVLELGAPLAMVHRRIGLVWVVSVWGFHVGVLALMAIAFPYPLSGVAFAPFFRVEKLLDRRPFRWLRTLLG